MRCIIAGSRHFHDYAKLEWDMESLFLLDRNRSGQLDAYRWPTTIVSGHANGADTEGEHFARLHGIGIELFLADWKTHGNGAGPIRNSEMLAADIDMVVAEWDGVSRGTFDLLNKAIKKGIEVHAFSF